MEEYFRVIRRNHGHWDITTDRGRAFRIRGEPGAYIVLDEREAPFPRTTGFRTVTSAMTFACEALMHEDLQLEGSSPTVIDSSGNPVLPNAHFTSSSGASDGYKF